LEEKGEPKRREIIKKNKNKNKHNLHPTLKNNDTQKVFLLTGSLRKIGIPKGLFVLNAYRPLTLKNCSLHSTPIEVQDHPTKRRSIQVQEPSLNGIGICKCRGRDKPNQFLLQASPKRELDLTQIAISS
jgi:hypothetical protein